MKLFAAIGEAWGILTPTARRRFIPIFLLMLLGSAVEVVGLSSVPVFLSILVQKDAALGQPIVAAVAERLDITTQRELLYAGGTVVVAIFTFQTALLLTLAYAISRFRALVISNVCEAIFEGYIRAPISFHIQRHSSEVASKVGIESTRFADSFVQPLMICLQSLFMITAIMVLLLVTSSLTALGIVFAVGVLGGGIIMFIRKRARRHGAAWTRHNATLNEGVSEALGVLRHIRLRGLEPNLLADFRKASWARARAIGFLAFSTEFPRPLLEGLAIAGMMAIAFLMVGSGTEVGEVVPLLGLIGVGVARMLPHITKIVRALLAMIQHVSVVETISRDLHQFRALGLIDPDGGHADDNAGSAAGPERQAAPDMLLRDRIQLREVSFSYPGADKPSVNRVSLDIAKNSAVALVGPTGAGKSTLVDLVCGLIEPETGQVLVDGHDIAGHLTAWQRNIGYIPQAIFLANRSLRENVGLGLKPEQIDDARVREVLSQAQLGPFVDSLPDGLDTQVGENGVRLSGGQRQRIGVARALYHDPEILVFDEATAALDNDTERRLMAAIDAVRANRTLIMIAHRLSSIRNCDRIFVMEQGSLTGQGTYDELLDSHASFRALAA